MDLNCFARLNLCLCVKLASQVLVSSFNPHVYAERKGISISAALLPDVFSESGNISACKVKWMKRWRMNAFPETIFDLNIIQRGCESEWV